MLHACCMYAACMYVVCMLHACCLVRRIYTALQCWMYAAWLLRVCRMYVYMLDVCFDICLTLHCMHAACMSCVCCLQIVTVHPLNDQKRWLYIGSDIHSACPVQRPMRMSIRMSAHSLRTTRCPATEAPTHWTTARPMPTRRRSVIRLHRHRRQQYVHIGIADRLSRAACIDCAGYPF